MQEREALKFSYVYQIDGKETELMEMPTDTSAKFISMKAINEKEARPLVTDYHLWAEGDTTDYTKESFIGNRVMVIVPNIHHTYEKAFSDISVLAKDLEKKKISVWLVSASTDAEVNELRHRYQLSFPALSADVKVLKTIIRSSPGIWLLKDGTVKGKWSAYQLPSASQIEERLTKVQE
jgi:peroxiredoxin